MLLAVIALLALTRAELVARMKAPVLTMTEGLVKVYADCPEDMRRDYQMPVARFAAERDILAAAREKLARLETMTDGDAQRLAREIAAALQELGHGI